MTILIALLAIVGYELFKNVPPVKRAIAAAIERIKAAEEKATETLNTIEANAEAFKRVTAETVADLQKAGPAVDTAEPSPATPAPLEVAPSPVVLEPTSVPAPVAALNVVAGEAPVSQTVAAPLVTTDIVTQIDPTVNVSPSFEPLITAVPPLPAGVSNLIPTPLPPVAPGPPLVPADVAAAVRGQTGAPIVLVDATAPPSSAPLSAPPPVVLPNS